MQALVICDNNWGIAYKGRNLASIPNETKTRMKEIEGKVIVYDLPHLAALPGSQPVAASKNYIYTAGIAKKVKGALCFDNLSDLRNALEKENNEKVYIIHGSSLYKEFMDDIETVHVTKIDYEYKADEWFENLDKNEKFTLTADSDELYCFDIVYSFLKYERK